MSLAGRVRELSHLHLFVLVALATLVLGSLFAYPRNWSQGYMGTDEFWHALPARHIYQGDGYVTSALLPMIANSVEEWPVPEPLKQSGLSLATAAVWSITGVGIKPVIAMVLIFYAIAAGLAAVLAARVLVSKTAGLVVGLLVICNPMMLAYNTAPVPQAMIFAGFMAITLLLLNPTMRRVILAGLVTAAVMILKGYIVIYLPIVCAYLYFAMPRRRLAAPAAYVAAFVGTLLIAQVVLPAGSVRLFDSGGNYALSFLHEWYYRGGDTPWHDLHPPNPWRIVAERPLEFAGFYARQASRSKRVLDTLAGPAVGGVFFPLLLLALGLFAVNAVSSRRLLPLVEDSQAPRHLANDVLWQLWFGGSIVTTLVFFWSISTKMMYFVHLYPMMLMLVAALLWRLAPLCGHIPDRLSRILVLAMLGYGLAYPAAYALRRTYVDRFAFLGTSLTVRLLDFGEMSKTLARYVPADEVVMADMPSEVAWFNGNRTVGTPLDDGQFRTLVQRFDVKALYERPGSKRVWPYMQDEFVLVDEANGRLWIRRDALR